MENKMKLLILVFLLVSCGTVERPTRQRVARTSNYIHQKLTCIKDLIGTHGVEAEKAANICERVYKRGK